MPKADGHWPVPPASVRLGRFIRAAALPFRRAIEPQPIAPSSALHRAGLCEPVSITELPTPTPTVSVIILNRQGAAMLDELLSSFYRVNRYPNVDLTVVDHGSTDDSVSVAEKWAATLPLKIMRRPDNPSFSFSCNRAAERATGEYLMLLNNDVVLSEDLIGPMVAAVARHGGMAGCKLLDAAWEPGERPTAQHIGVRFTANRRRRLFGPYDVRPAESDAELAAAPSHFPAVTAAVAVCRRADYLRIGGLCEDYMYGFEDVDLNLKFALHWGRKNICLNHIAAFHHGRATRRTIARPRRKTWLENNFRVFSRRFGYAVRRTMVPALLTDDGSLWGGRASIGFVPDQDGEACATVMALARRQDWKFRRVRDHDLTNLTLLIVTDPRYRLNLARNRHPLMQRIAWVTSDARHWRPDDFASYDLVLAAHDALAADLTKQHGIPAAMVAPQAPDAGERIVALLTDYLRARHRIAIKCATPEDGAMAYGLATALRRAGNFVRIDRRAQWRCADTLRDDVAILMPGVRLCPPADDKIVVACADACPNGRVDIRLPVMEPEAFCAAALDAVAPMHARRMRGPSDPPLTGYATRPLAAVPMGRELAPASP